MCLGWGTNLPRVPLGCQELDVVPAALPSGAGSAQRGARPGPAPAPALVFPTGKPCSVPMPPLWGRQSSSALCRAGLCLPLTPLGALWHLSSPNSCPRCPQSPPALPSVLHLTQGMNLLALPVTAPSPWQEEAGEGFFLLKNLQDTVLVGSKERQVDISAFNSMWKVLHTASANSAGVGNSRGALKTGRG